MDDFEYMLSNLSDNFSNNTLSLWDVRKHDKQFVEFEVFAEKIEDYNKNDLLSEINHTFVTCHVCDENVPILFRKQHYSSAKHKTYKNIIEICLDRLKRQMDNEEIDQNLTKINKVHFCDKCTVAVADYEKFSHNFSEVHLHNIAKEKALTEFEKLLRNNKEFNLNETIYDFVPIIDKEDPNENLLDKENHKTIDPSKKETSKKHAANENKTISSNNNEILTIREVDTDLKSLEDKENDYKIEETNCPGKISNISYADAAKHLNSNTQITNIESVKDKTIKKARIKHCEICDVTYKRKKEHLRSVEHFENILNNLMTNTSDDSKTGVNESNIHATKNENKNEIDIEPNNTVNAFPNGETIEENEEIIDIKTISADVTLQKDLQKAWADLSALPITKTETKGWRSLEYYCDICDIIVPNHYKNREEHRHSDINDDKNIKERSQSDINDDKNIEECSQSDINDDENIEECSESDINDDKNTAEHRQREKQDDKSNYNNHDINTVGESKQSVKAQSSAKEFSDKIMYFFDKTKHENMFACRVCYKLFGGKICQYHVNDKKHCKNYNELLSENKIKVTKWNNMYCKLCKIQISKRQELIHIENPEHRNKLEEKNIEVKEISLYYCKVCDVNIINIPVTIECHLKHNTHKRNEKNSNKGKK